MEATSEIRDWESVLQNSPSRDREPGRHGWIEELAPGMEVHFAPTTMVNFVVSHPVLKINLTEGSGDWLPSVLADKSHEELKALIKKFSNGKIR